MHGRQHDGKHEGVDQQEQERVDERPQEPERRAAIARLQLACDEALNEPAVAKQVAEVGKHDVRVRRSAARDGGRYDRILARVATWSRISDLSSAMRARSASMSTAGRDSRSSARRLA